MFIFRININNTGKIGLHVQLSETLDSVFTWVSNQVIITKSSNINNYG